MTLRVHVVALADDWILQRYASILARELGWTVSDKPRADVDVNHYMPYLLFGESCPSAKCTAWFTHLEENEPRAKRHRSKTSRWHRAARAMDLRVCQAEKYRRALVHYGTSVVIPTPAQARFKPRPLVVGVGGRVYKLGRKGEHLVAQLMAYKEFKVIASGQGWPCPTKFYEWKDMPGFYQSLDVFLVTSLVEGGPDTVIEALACGVPVVAPFDVGFCDEFRLFHYVKGDFASMLATLQSFNDWRRSLRAQVQGRTEEAFAQAYAKALQEHLS